MAENGENNMPDKDLEAIKARKARRLRREKLLEEQRIREAAKARSIRGTIIVAYFWGILILIFAGIWYCVKNGIAADFLTHQGQKYLQVREYDKALKMLKIAESMSPDDEDIIYLQVIALSKMPVSYENQKALYEISQYDDCDEAGEYAYKVLLQMRKQIDALIGSNYIDNVMYDDIVFRWNNKKPIKYTILLNGYWPSEYIAEIKKAFTAWSALSNGSILFNEIRNVEDADIVVSLSDALPDVDYNDTLRSAVTVPVINNNILSRVDIILKSDFGGMPGVNTGAFSSVIKTQIGHALGIGGYSSDESDVMHSSGDYISKVSPSKGFTVRDFNTLTLLYKMIPDVINEPLLPEEYNGLFWHEAITAIPGDSTDIDMKHLMNYLNNNPSDIPKWIDLASEYGIKKHYKHANAILRSLLPLVQDNNQNCFVVLYNISANYYKMKDYPKALKYIKSARKLDNTDFDALILETFIELKSKNKDYAFKKLVAINKKYPDNTEVALKLAYIYRKNKQSAKVNEVINNLIKSNPNAGVDKRVQKYKH